MAKFGTQLQKVLMLLGCFIVVLLANSSAMAEDQFDFLKFSCIPQLGYFSLQTQHVWQNRSYIKLPNKSFSESMIQLTTDFQLSVPKKISDQPYKCSLKGQLIEVYVLDYAPAKESGECSARVHFYVQIKINGEEIDKFPAYGLNPCQDDEEHVVEITPYKLQNCTLQNSYGSGSVEPSCEMKTLNPVKTVP